MINFVQENIIKQQELLDNRSLFIACNIFFPARERNIHFLSGDSLVGYLMMTFTETSLLITMGDVPNFELTIWNWRSGEKISAIQTEIRTVYQSLK